VGDDPESGRKRRWSFSLPEEKELTQLGPYEILGTLGKGNQGEVYRARDSTLDREVALKVLRARTATAQARFQREAEATAALDHPGIVRVHASGREDDLSYVVYELIEGAQTLGEAFAENPPPERVAGWILEAAQALGAAHAAGIVHRDLKPGNLLLDGEGKVRVADFGLAQTAEGSSLTATQAAVGTPRYMSPEQIRGGGETGPPADVWGLGVVLYEGLCGELPFQAETLAALTEEVLRANPEPPSARAPGVPAALEAVCLRCLRRDPGERYPDGAALAASLVDALRSPAQAPRSPLGSAALVVTGCLLLAAGLAVSLPGPRTTPAQTSPSAAADPLAFQRALQARDWRRAERLAEASRERQAWRLRLTAERAASRESLQVAFEAAFPPALRRSTRAQEVAALCSARAAFLRGEPVLPWLQATEGDAPWRRVARAEALLFAERPHEARDVLAALDPVAESGPLGTDPLGTWCDAADLRAALDEVCSENLAGDWGARPPLWRAAAAGWSRGEARHLLRWVLRRDELAHLPQAAEDPTPRVRALLANAARLWPSEEDALLAGALGALELERAEALAESRPQGLAALALRRGAAAALARPEAPPPEVSQRWAALLERVRPEPGEDPWGVQARSQSARSWIEGRLALASGQPALALAAFERADPAGHHPGVAADRLRAAEEVGERVEEAREQLAILKGSHREEANSRIRALRHRYREGPAPAALLDEALALDPLNRETHHARVVANFQLGKGSAEDLICSAERWLFYDCFLHRQFFERCVSSAVTARLGRTMLPLLQERATPLGRWILDGLEGEASGLAPEGAQDLLDRAPDLSQAPGSLAPRLTRAFLAIRAGRLGTAEADLAWVLRIAPNHGLAHFYRCLLLGKRGARSEEVCYELALALTHGFQSFRLPTWSPRAYPELEGYPTDAASPLGRTLRTRGWKPRARER